MAIAELDKTYKPHAAETKWLETWESRGYFTPDPNSDRPRYSIVIPPPNVTDILHLGHALNNTMQDIMVRYKRMAGFETEWLPGTDHAGIATQVVVEKQLIDEGSSREALGRDKFVERVWKWKDRNAGAILEQLRLMGCSCDWTRTRFTLDDGLSNAVKEVFVRLHDRGLVYRGHYVINWCPRCLTTLSDDELQRQDEDGSLWYIRYPIEGSDESLMIATTRPETMLGDTAVAVHPRDKRYKKLVGKTAILPLVGRRLPIVADDYIEMEFGTGALKVTPAHDINDYEIGKRHDLETVDIFNADATIAPTGGKYKGLSREEARKRVVADLEAEGYLTKIEPYKLAAARCYRCETKIEPRLSEQWFVKMDALAKPAIDAVKSGRVRFHPSHWAKVYLHWMENIRDWCISRQLWWGHRIPVYYKDGTTEYTVAKEPPNDGGTWRQEDDVLDTWFSSWLWPFSTFGWPEQTDDLKAFYPTGSLFTASEIIFLWVARMVMAGQEFMGGIPFSDVYIHGTVRDTIGRKMSKSLGNGIDPRQIIEDYGSDALRSALVLAAPEGQDPLVGEKSFELGRNFANKLWNAARLVFMNQPSTPPERPIDLQAERDVLHEADRWILSRAHRTIASVTEQTEAFRFNAAAKTLYDFVWGDYCDWYLELVKPRYLLDVMTREKMLAQQVSLEVLKVILKLLHPMMPFVTEELWSALGEFRDGNESEHITVASWPVANERWVDVKLESAMERVFEVISTVRAIRSEMKIPPAKTVDCVIRVDRPKLAKNIATHEENVRILGRIESLTVGNADDVAKPSPAASGVIRDAEIFVPLAGVIDIELERSRLQKELDRITGQLERVNKKLSNEDFLGNAPDMVVSKEKAKRENFEQMVLKLNRNLEQLVGW